MYKILVLAGRSLFGAAQASAMATYIANEGIPHAIISSNVGNLNNLLYNQTYHKDGILNNLQIGESIKGFWNGDGVDYYKVDNNTLFTKPKFDTMIKNPIINKSSRTYYILDYTMANGLTMKDIEYLIYSSINVPLAVITPKCYRLSTSYCISNLAHIIKPLIVEEGIDALMDKIKVTVIYNSIGHESISDKFAIDRLLSSLSNENVELFYLTKSFYPHEVNIIQVPSLLHIDIFQYNYERDIEAGQQAYLDSINY